MIALSLWSYSISAPLMILDADKSLHFMPKNTLGTICTSVPYHSSSSLSISGCLQPNQKQSYASSFYQTTIRSCQDKYWYIFQVKDLWLWMGEWKLIWRALNALYDLSSWQELTYRHWKSGSTPSLGLRFWYLYHTSGFSILNVVARNRNFL